MKTIEEKTKTIDVVKQMVTDGQISQDVAEKYFPELKESEDEMVREELIEQVVYIVPNDDEVDSEGNVLPTYQKRIDKYLAWLEKQGEQKPAWSEEDEEMYKEVLTDIIYAKNNLEAKGCLGLSKRAMEAFNWFSKRYESFRPQSQWKPSKEQMKALWDSIPENVKEISEREMLLDSLYQDLKKL